MMSGMFFMLMLFSAGGGGGGDLLDYAQVEPYWQMQDQRIVSVETMSAVLADDESSQTDRLMAIRALGEIARTQTATAAEQQAALALLRGLTESETPFEAEYAARSIAWIEGEEPAPRSQPTPEAMALDLALLSPDTNMVGQWRIRNGAGPVDIDAMVPAGLFGEFGPSREELMEGISQGVLQAVMMVGNARIDAVTFGMTMTNAEPEGFVMVGRGQYDRIAVQIAIEDLVEAEAQGGPQELATEVNSYSINDTEILAVSNQWMSFALIMPSDQVIVWMMNVESSEPLDIDGMVARVAAGGNEAAFTSELVTAEIDKIDLAACDAWFAMEMPQIMRTEVPEMFGPFTAAHATAAVDDEGIMHLDWEAVGDNADAIAAATAFMNNGLAEGRREIREEMQREDDALKAMMAPLVDIMDSIHVESEGTTLTGGLEADTDAAMSLPFLMFMGF